MYFEERMIDGVMCYRTNPDDEFTPFDIRELSRRYDKCKEELSRIIHNPNTDDC